ncbi:Immunoglobulin A1 protease [Wickerhamomyces ciferrii]|uniref:Immunoglobulin A1 protease n=1 Tax=Wickerhamomyces ciferrii (strain ATCC 14091 / BCRC 22168 / CBS 111 / JCM 3599 / NBRC 0793 / NRRL Y-1031 F-60-10) TaxID=1206466 RepID=K0KJH2_WICCF|nr:Immunoglobulin A1 protease [Wickerhamomyces ciferrii]CCH42257.1 Immunoglobulin A1 protease [Wickerhamomyces ciferrii]
MDVEGNVEDFLQRVKQLDNQRQREDEERRKKLKDDIQTYKMRDSFNIQIPNPIARKDEQNGSPPPLPKRKPNLSSIPNSESLQNFNKSVSKQYRLDMDELIYESAYNYEKAQKSPSKEKPTIPLHTENLTRSLTERSRKNLDINELPKRSSTIFNPSSNDSQFRATTGGLTKGLEYEAYDRLNEVDHNDDSKFRSSTGSLNREKTYKKFDKELEIKRFDDYIPNSTQSFKSSRYSKFQLSDEEKKQMDETINNLIGDGFQISKNTNQIELQEQEDDQKIPKPLTRERKGGILPSSKLQNSNPSLSSPFQSPKPQINSWTNAAKEKPKPSLNAQSSSSLSQLKRSPRKTELSSPTKIDYESSITSSPIKKSPAKLDFSKFTKDNENQDRLTPPPIAPKPLGFTKLGNDTGKRTSWLNSAAGKTSSTPQWQDTSVNYQINKKNGNDKPSWLNSAAGKTSSTSQWQDTSVNYQIKPQTDKKASWLNSATRNTSSTPQGQDTTSKIHIETSEDRKQSWLNSAMRNTSHREFEIPQPKIKPIIPSKSNTLQEKLKKEQEFKEQQHLTLKELENRKLNHIDNQPRSLPKFEPEDTGFSPTILKKTRTGSPSKNLTIPDDPDFLKQKLSPASKSPSPAPSETLESPEAINHKSKLKPALPARKLSLKIPEALQKVEKLKPALPARKPSIEIPEALTKKGNLRQANKLEQLEEPTPEAVNKKSQLKPAVPQRKISQKEVEALAQFNELKSRKNGIQSPEIKPKPRVFSNSKDILNNQLGSLKSTKEKSQENSQVSLTKEEKSKNLENVLRLKKASTDSELNPVRLPFMATTDNLPNLKKASTFDSSSTGKLQDEGSTENLEHLTKKRTKGPKRRTKAPKNV